MSSDGGGMLGSGGFFGNSSGPGRGGFFGNDMSPRGRFGIWPSCGCSSLFIILAGILLVCGGGLRMLNM